MIEVTVDDEAGDALPEGAVDELSRRLTRMVDAAGLAEGGAEPLEVALLLTGDARIAELNRDYRGIDEPTDVLAFAQREGEGGDLHPEVLGDIVISVDTAARQATRGLAAELAFLAAHGLCHLLGYDHQTDAEEAEMNARMATLLAEADRDGPVAAA